MCGLLRHTIRQSMLLCSASTQCRLPCCASSQPWLYVSLPQQTVPTSLCSTAQVPLFTVLQGGTLNIHNTSALLKSWLNDLTELWLQQSSAASPQDVAPHIR